MLQTHGTEVADKEYRNKIAFRLGGLYTAMNFLKTIRLTHCWIWFSDVLGEAAMQLVLSGKAYNKAMRAHKLTLLALWCILLPTLQNRTRNNTIKFWQWQAAYDNHERIADLINCRKQEWYYKLLKFCLLVEFLHGLHTVAVHSCPT